MPLSTNTLFHFTDSINVLFTILEEGFWPRYSKETGWGKEKEIQFAIPMVSFCNIPLSQIGKHIDFYGSYGIGISMKLALERKTIQPVSYTTKSDMKKTIQAILECNKTKEIGNEWISIFTRIKPYKGWNWKNKNEIPQTQKEYCFYDEREWRYIPNIRSIKRLFVNLEEYADLKCLNQEMEKQYLKPNLSDISYIIIETEAERVNVLNKIDKLFGDKHTQNDISLLKSKIISCQQIKRDF